MCSELFRIPYSWGGVPIFGVGVLLAIWAIAAAATLVRLVRHHGWNADTLSSLPVLLLLGAAILFLPRVFPDGLPIRGYGVMLLVGITAGVGMAMHRARQGGLDPEIIISLGDLDGGVRHHRRAVVLRHRILAGKLRRQEPARYAAGNRQHSRRRPGDFRRIHRRGGGVHRVHPQAALAAVGDGRPGRAVHGDWLGVRPHRLLAQRLLLWRPNRFALACDVSETQLAV